MDFILIVIAGTLGALIGYLFFYWRFGNRNLVNDLRDTNVELKTMLQMTERDRQEYEQQNIILKDEIDGLYRRNDDLTHIVSELSRYYYHMKKISEKMESLATDLQQPLEDLDKKMKPLLYSPYDERSEEFVLRLDDDKVQKRSDFF